MSDVRPWVPADGDSRCQECGDINLTWYADDEVWNLVMGGPEATDDPGGVLCIPCFSQRSHLLGLGLIWRMRIEDGIIRLLKREAL